MRLPVSESRAATNPPRAANPPRAGAFFAGLVTTVVAPPGEEDGYIYMTSPFKRPCRLFWKYESDPDTSFRQLTDYVNQASLKISSISYNIRPSYSEAHNRLVLMVVEQDTGRERRTIATLARQPRPNGVSQNLQHLRFWGPCLSTSGRLYTLACDQAGENMQKYYSDDGLLFAVGHGNRDQGLSYLYWAFGRLFGSTHLYWSPPSMNRLLHGADNSTADLQEAVALRAATGDSSHSSYILPSAFEVRGYRRLAFFGLSSSNISDNYNFVKPAYVGNDGVISSNLPDFKFPPNKTAKSVSALCFNPNSGLYLVSATGGETNSTYLVSSDWYDSVMVSDGVTSDETSTSGATQGCVDTPDGGFLIGSNQNSNGHISKVSPNGQTKRVFTFPKDSGGTVYSICAFEDGEVWACTGSDEKKNAVAVSLDWGESWQLVYYGPAAAFTFNNPPYHPFTNFIAQCHQTRRIHGNYVFCAPWHVNGCGLVFRRLK